VTWHHLPHPLGRTVWHDPRSLSYPAPRGALTRRKWRHAGRVLDQGQLGSCTGNALAQVGNTKPCHKLFHRLWKEDDAVHFYERGTQEDEYTGTYPPDDSGSSGNGVCLAALQDGVIESYSHAFGIDHALEALMLQPIMIGIGWTNSMFYPDENGWISPEGGDVGGHELAVVGFDVDPTYGEYVWLLNSWGKGWGRRGYAKLKVTDLDDRLRRQGDATVPVFDS